MEASPWTLTGQSGNLNQPPLAARVHLIEPSTGITGLRLGEVALDKLNPLAFNFPGDGRPSGGNAYLRGDDVIATYEESESTGARIEVYWRALPAKSAAGQVSVGIELQISAQTSRLDSNPQMMVQSRWPAGTIARLAAMPTESNSHAPELESLGAPADAPCHCDASQGPGCFTIELPNGYRYVEMIHPGDFRAAELATADEDDGSLVLRHRLFPTQLEKGVILRARLRSVWLSPGDANQVAAAYQTFVDSEPPLTT